MENNVKVKRIALLGAESTGKTTLARALALRYQTVWVPEVAREHLMLTGSDYTADTIEHIAREQLQQENNLVQHAHKFLFTDTEFIISKVWAMDVFGSCPEWIEQQITEHRYDLFLLTTNDLPWVADPVRVNPQRRDYFFNWYKRELESHQLPFEIISGRYEARLFSAISALQKHFGSDL